MPETPHPLEMLLLTNFSDYCFRMIPSIAQLADSLPARLTLLHVYDPKRSTGRQAAEALESYFPEADRYPSCRRVVAQGPLVDVVKRQMRVAPVHVIVAPASDPIGLPRFGDRSLRAQLVEACGVPLWTMGRGVDPAMLVRPIRNVACWLDYRADRYPHLPFAIAFAQRLGATLHVLYGLPSIDEGQILPPGHPDKALHPDLAVEELRRLCAGSSAQVEIHVAQGEGRRTINRLVRQCRPDLVFLRNEEWLLSRWFGLGVGLRLGDGSPCPAIYVSDTPSIPVWRFETVPAARPREAEVVAVGLRAARTGGRTAIELADLAAIGLA